MFKDSQNRIKSMALIHEKLYQSKNMACIDFARYIRNLVDHLFQSYRTHPNIRINMDIGEVLLDIDTAIPCGLIINELVSNSLKHAFPDSRDGKIDISIHPFKKDQKPLKYKMVVTDDGVGFPTDKDFRNTESLGFQLVHSLLVKLKGQIELEKDSGTKFNIVFSELKYKKRI